MRVARAILFSSIGMAFFRQPQAQIDGSGTEIPAAVRLRDFLLRSRYPETNRLLKSDDLALFETAQLPGDASAAATVTAFAGEKLHRGSLKIFFRVTVHRSGFYTFRTQLAPENGKPVIEALLHQQLKAGEQTLYFYLYGKAIRDCGAAAPFILPGIIGEKLPGEDGIDTSLQGALQPFKVQYKTQPYGLAEFTTRDWDSPDKQATIKRLQREIQQESRKHR